MVIWILLIISNSVCIGFNATPTSAIEFYNKEDCEVAQQKVIESSSGRCINAICVRKGIAL